MTSAATVIEHVDPRRAANASLKGYLYQFDRTILAILKSHADTTVIIEGIEDIDILEPAATTSEQVKYWSSKSYGSPRALRKPVESLLKARASGAPGIPRIYVHFGANRAAAAPPVPTGLTSEEIRTCINYRGNPIQIKDSSGNIITIDDDTINQLSRQLEIVEGPSFDSQKEQVIEALTVELKLSTTDVTDLAYPLALTCVHQIAVKKSAEERQLSRADFIERINKREILYTRWHKQVMEESKYVSAALKRFKDDKTLDRMKSVAFVTHPQMDPEKIADIAVNFANAFNSTSPRTLDSHVPRTLIIEGSASHATTVKKRLAGLGILFNDGYEGYSFNPNIFYAGQIIVPSATNKSVVKKSSYSVRVVTSESLMGHQPDRPSFNTIVAFCADAQQKYSSYADYLAEMPGMSIDSIKRIVKEAL